MTSRKEWFSVQELIGLPGMPGTERGTFKSLQKNLNVSRKKLRGKGLEYSLNSLPPETQAHIHAQLVADVMAALPASLQQHHPETAKAVVVAVARPVSAIDSVADCAGSAMVRGAKAPKQTKPGHDVALKATAASTLPPSAYQTNEQRAVADARQSVLRHIKRLEEQTGCTTRRAMLTFLTQAAAGRLDGDTATAMLALSRDSRGRKASNAHVNAQGLPTLRTLQLWMSRQEAGAPGDNLAPIKRLADMTMEPWMVLAVELKRRPQKPTTTQVLEQMKAGWGEYSARWVQRNRAERGGMLATPEQLTALAARLTFPSYDQVARFFRDKFSQIDLLDGQHLGSALREHKFYQHRTNAGLEPFVEVHADGWNTHFLAPHPVTGEYVSYEVWHFHDVATRYTTPFSIGLSESADVIMKGLENCIRVGGVPAIWQTDSTGSVKNAKVQFDPVASLSARAGLTVVHPQTVGNSQANGIAENYNTRLDRESRALATYMHPERMDSLAFKQVKKFTGQMVKAAAKGDVDAHKLARAAALRVGKGLLFESKEQMVTWLDEMRIKSNNAPHSALKKITDSTGKVRHQSPQEALDEAIAKGWIPVALDEASLVELFYEHVRRVVDRETVKAFGGQRYRHADLGAFQGKEVLVAIDTMDGDRVWVKELSGRLICEARFVSATGYRGQSMYEFALQKRMNAQIKHKENQIASIERRMDPANAPIEVRATDVSDSTGLTGGLSVAEIAYSNALIRLAEHRAEEAQLTQHPTAEPMDFALRMFGEQIDAEEKARAEGVTQASDDGGDLMARIDEMLKREEEEQRRQAM